MSSRYAILFISLGLVFVVIFFSLSHTSLTNQFWEILLRPYLSYDWWSRLQHSLAYGVLALWLMLILPNHKLQIAFILTGLGFTLEIIQYFIPYRSFDWLDLLFGTLGIFSIYLIFILVARIRN